MRFPEELWTEKEQRQLIGDLLNAFEGTPIILTDELANTVYFSREAETIFGDRAEALVNRLSLSLLGFGNRDKVPEALINALLGKQAPWRGVVNPTGREDGWRFAEASAVVKDGTLICGVIRVSEEGALGNPRQGTTAAPDPAQTVKVGVLVSGRGSNLRALLAARAAGKLPAANFVVVLSNNPKAPALDVARAEGIPALGISHKNFKSREEHEKELITHLKDAGVELVVLAGYMRLVTPSFLKAFPHRVINIHPSLLPAFPGINAQGQAHRYGVRHAGLTVHFVNEETDGGPIILQRVVPVLQDDSEDTLSARILAEEHKALPLAVDLYTRRRLLIDGRRVIITRGETSFPEEEAGLHAVDPLLIATGNPHKVEEISAILADLPICAISTSVYPDVQAEPEENGTTYEANARIKAEFWHDRGGLWTLADDSGLEVDALDGRPGLHSSRYAQSAQERISKMLGELEGVPAEKRRARFVCTVVLVSPAGDVYTETGTCEGQIAFEAKGDKGFGYDPIFIPDGFDGKHLAELAEDVKNQISHRSRALQKLRPTLARIFGERT